MLKLGGSAINGINQGGVFSYNAKRPDRTNRLRFLQCVFKRRPVPKSLIGFKSCNLKSLIAFITVAKAESGTQIKFELVVTVHGVSVTFATYPLSSCYILRFCPVFG